MISSLVLHDRDPDFKDDEIIQQISQDFGHCSCDPSSFGDDLHSVKLTART